MTDTQLRTGDTQPDNSDKLDKSVLMVAGVVVLGAIMSILDITVVSVALETFQREFDATAAEVAWTMTGYTLALASVIPLTGWAADRFGTKRLYLLAVLLFTAGSVLCATATSLELLVLYRVLQGLGGGMLMPLGMTILTRAAGPERVGRVMAVLGIPMLLGPIFGPILGGALIDSASWHWIFLINLPIGIAAIVYAWIVLPQDEVEPSETFDWLGMVLLSPGLAAFLYGVSSIPEHGTVTATEVWLPAVLGIALIVAFVPWALAKRNIHPLVELRLFKNRNMTVAIIAMMLFAIAFFGASLLFPLYFIQVRGEDALGAGLLLAPQGVGAMITMPIAGILADRIGPGKIVLAGITVITVGHGDVHPDRRRHVVRLHAGRALRHGPRHGRHDDADHDRGARDPHRAQRGPRLDAAQHHPAGRGLDRHGALLGDPHQPDQGQRHRRRLPRVALGPGRPVGPGGHRGAVRAAARPVHRARRGRARSRWPTRSRRSSSSRRSWWAAA